MGDLNLIQRGDLIQRLARALEIKGQRAPALHLDPSVIPMVVLEDLTRQTEFLNPKDRAATFAFNSPAVVGENSFIAVVNPLGSGIVLVVDEVLASVAVASIVTVGVQTQTVIAGTGAGAICAWLDRRNDGVPTGIPYAGSDPVDIASAGDLMTVTRVGSAGPSILWGWGACEPRPIVVRPGWGVVALNNTVNSGFQASMRWREISEP